jgi:2-iminobutanoate/2-iminopropanoate deaminase
MANVEVKYPGKVAATGSYSPGLIRDGWLYVSGHCSQDMQSGEIIHGSIEDETRLALRHIGKILAAAGCGFEDVVKCTCHLSDINDFGGFDTAYREFFQNVKPARTTVESVLWDGAKVEIDAIARIPEGADEH